MREKNRRGEGHHLESDLVAAAARLLAAPSAPQTPSLRAVAREAGVSPSAVYLHFDSQAGLARAVVAAEFDRLRTALQGSEDPSATPIDRLVTMGKTYAEWAQSNPGAYQLLFDTPDVSPPEGEQWSPGLDLLHGAAARLERLREDQGDALRFAGLLWSSWHGLIALRRAKTGAPWNTSLDEDVAVLTRAIAGQYQRGAEAEALA